MNKDKMELEESKEYLPFIIRDLEASDYNQNFINALKTIKIELENSIPKKKIEDKIKELQNMIMKSIEGKIQKYTPGEMLLVEYFLQELLKED